MSDISTQPEFVTYKICIQCNEPIAVESKFCKHCGVIQNNDNVVASEQKWLNIKIVALFFTLDAVLCAIASFIHVFRTLGWSIAFDATLAIIAVTFFCDNWSENKSLLVWRNFSFLRLLMYCAGTIICSVVVHYVVSWINFSLFSKRYSYYSFYARNGHGYGAELMIFFVAIMPALFEELGYLGFVLQKLLAVVDRKQAIFISAFLFAIMHMSFISLFWLIPFALLLGYVRVKENTLWYGVCMHFCFNFTVCVLELYKFR